MEKRSWKVEETSNHSLLYVQIVGKRVLNLIILFIGAGLNIFCNMVRREK